MLAFKFSAYYRKATADVHAVINHKAGQGESKHRPGRLQPEVDQKCSTDLQLYKHTR